MTVYASRAPTTRKIPPQMARTNKETSRIDWAGVERGLKMLVTLVGTSAANAGLTRNVAAIQKKHAAPSTQCEAFFTFLDPFARDQLPMKIRNSKSETSEG